MLVSNNILLAAGVETSRQVDASVSTYTIDGLQPDSPYTVQVSTLTGSREGTPAVLDVKTGISLDQPNTQNNRCKVYLFT